VFLGKRKSTNEQVAVKINHVMSQKEKDILAILQKNTHAHVIGIVDIFDQNG
jgi:DNA-directed RNA polymerase subunit F